MSSGHIRQRSPGHYELKYDLPRGPGGQRRTRTESYRGGKKGAEKRLRELLAAVDRGEHVNLTKVTVGAHVHARIEHWQGAGRISAGTTEHYRQLLGNYIEPYFGAIQLQRLTTLDLERWHMTLRQHIGGQTLKGAHRLLKQALAEGVRHGLLSRNVAELERAPKAAATEIQSLDHDQVREVLTRLEEHPLYAAVVIALNSGIRRGELLALEWRDVDLERGVVRIDKSLEETKAYGLMVKLTKTPAGRRDIRLPEIVIAALRAHRREQLELRIALGLGKLPENMLVFPAGPEGGHLSPRGLSIRWRRAVRSLDLPQMSWHGWRHTHASMLIDAGIDVVMVSRRLGHANPAITLAIYAHKFRPDDSRAADAIDAVMAGLK